MSGGVGNIAESGRGSTDIHRAEIHMFLTEYILSIYILFYLYLWLSCNAK